MTDIACLMRNYGGSIREKIKTIGILAGRFWGRSLMQSNASKEEGGVNASGFIADFNIWKNPTAMEELLKTGLGEKLVIIPIELSGNADTSFTVEELAEQAGVDHCNHESRQYILSNSILHAQGIKGFLGFEPPRLFPYDALVFYQALQPNAFTCGPAKAAVLWCESDQVHCRFMAPSKTGGNNTCAGHPVAAPQYPVLTAQDSACPIGAFATEAGQLWYCPNGKQTECVPDLPDVDAYDVTVCTEWASEQDVVNFKRELLAEGFW